VRQTGTIKKQITLTVINEEYTVPFVEGETLASLLRKRLLLTGTKIGCGESVCGTLRVPGAPPQNN